MAIPSELIGSLPRTDELLSAIAHADGNMKSAAVSAALDRAVRETVQILQESGSPVVSDGEQGKPSALTYPIAGADNLSSDGIVIPFVDGHQRQLPRLTAGPFRYRTYAQQYLQAVQKYTSVPVKQGVVSPSAMSLLYPSEGIAGYSREKFVQDLLTEAEADIRGCLDAGAHIVQLDFEEGRLSLKFDPSGGLLREFIELNNRVLERFTDAERVRIGVHTNPGGDMDSTHSLDVDYAQLLPELFQLRVGNFYLQLASEPDPDLTLQIIADHLPAGARVFVGVTDPIDPRVETAEEVCDRVLRAVRYIPTDQVGTCDDCGFSPFADDRSTSRETAFAKIRARLEGTALAAQQLEIGQ